METLKLRNNINQREQNPCEDLKRSFSGLIERNEKSYQELTTSRQQYVIYDGKLFANGQAISGRYGTCFWQIVMNLRSTSKPF